MLNLKKEQFTLHKNALGIGCHSYSSNFDLEVDCKEDSIDIIQASIRFKSLKDMKPIKALVGLHDRKILGINIKLYILLV